MSSGRSRSSHRLPLSGRCCGASCDSDRARPSRPASGPRHESRRVGWSSRTASAAPRTSRSRAEYAIAGAAAALAVSFIVLALAWRTPRFDAAHPRSPGARRGSRGLVDSTRASRSRCGCSGCVFFGVRRLGGRRGPGPADQPDLRGRLRAALGRHRADVAAVRPVLPGGQPAAHRPPGCFTRLTGGRPRGRRAARCPRWVGYWPASLGLLAFVWLELVYPGSTYLSPVRLWFAAYIAIVLVGAAAVRRPRGSSRPTRSRSTPRSSGTCRSFGRTDGRHAGAPQPARQPRRRRGAAGAGRRWSRCCSAAPRSTASRTPTSGCASPSRVSLSSTWLDLLALLVLLRWWSG